MDSAKDQRKPVLEIRNAQQFKTGAVLVMNIYGLLLGLPVVLAVAWVSFRPLGVSTYVIPLVAIGLATFCLPLGLGNLHARRLGRRLKPPFDPESARIMQLTARPRLQSGLRSLLEDADDIGYFRITQSEVVFFGDSVRLQAPIGAMESVSVRNIGFRGLFIYGARICITLKGVEPATFEFADRSSFWLPCARRETRKLYEKLAAIHKLNNPH